MLRLYVMRHAKSSWAIPGARDFDRELNERGIFDLEKISTVIRQKSYFPEQIICSKAVRTRQTLDGIIQAIKLDPEITFTEKLYSSGVNDYMEIIRGAEDAKPLMIIGHNPMCGALASNLAGSGDEAAIEEIAYRYPTGTITVLDFDCGNWSEIENQKGVLRDCIIPSKLRS